VTVKAFAPPEIFAPQSSYLSIAPLFFFPYSSASPYELNSISPQISTRAA
jgi:hypothetical protein